MAKDQNLEEVLIARNNDTGQVGAVTGLNEDGTPKMTDVKQLVIEVAEKDGGRHQSFVVENEDIVRANVIDELSIQ